MNKKEEKTQAQKPESGQSTDSASSKLTPVNAEAEVLERSCRDGMGAAAQTSAHAIKPSAVGVAQKKAPRPPLKKETKLAVGVSITVVLLALIITLVIIAVQSAKNVSQMYLTVFQHVDSTVRDELFIARLNGEFVLMNGDSIVSGRYARLEFNNLLGGYVYGTESGETGTLDARGKKQSAFTGNKPDLFTAVAFTDSTATFADSTHKYVTYNLFSGEAIAALNGIAPASLYAFATDPAYFTAKSGRYVILTSVGGELNLKTDLGKTYQTAVTAQSPQGFSIKAVQDDRFLLAAAVNNTAEVGLTLLPSGVSTGDYYQAFVPVKKQEYRYFSVGPNLYDENVNAYDGYGGIMRVKNNLFQSGTAVFAGGATVPQKIADNKTLTGGKKPYLYSDDGVFDEQGKLLLRANTKIVGMYGDSVVLDGADARFLTGETWVKDVKSVYLVDGVYFATDVSRAVYAPEGKVMTAEDVQTYGAPTFTNDVMVLKNGYVFALNTDYFCTGSKTVIPYVNGGKGSGQLARLGGSDAENFAVSLGNSIVSYRMGKNDVSVIAQFYYPNVQILSNSDLYFDAAFHGLIFSTQNGYGLMGANGRVQIKPQYNYLAVCNGFTVVGSSSADSSYGFYAMADYNGKLLTDFYALSNQADLFIMKDFVYFALSGGNGKLFSAQGKEELRNVYVAQKMTAYRFRAGKWAVDPTKQYVQLSTAQGVRVLKMQYDEKKVFGFIAAV